MCLSKQNTHYLPSSVPAVSMDEQYAMQLAMYLDQFDLNSTNQAHLLVKVLQVLSLFVIIIGDHVYQTFLAIENVTQKYTFTFH